MDIFSIIGSATAACVLSAFPAIEAAIVQRGVERSTMVETSLDLSASALESFDAASLSGPLSEPLSGLLSGPAEHAGLEGLLAGSVGGGLDLGLYRPDLPIPPDAGNIVALNGGSHSLSSNTAYLLTGNVGVLTIPDGAARIVIEGQGFSATGVRFPVQWVASPQPRCSDIRIAHLRRVGGDSSAFEVYGERILLEHVRCEESDIVDYGVYCWGGRHITLRDSYLHTQGAQAATRWVACENVAVYRCDLGTPSKHSMRVHASGGDSRWILWAGNRTSSPWYIGYQDRPDEGLIEHIVVIRNTYDSPTISGNNSWFQHAPPADSGGPKLSDFYFMGNSGPGTNLSASNLAGLESVATSTWAIAGNQY